MNLTQKQLKKVFYYDPNTGFFTRLLKRSNACKMEPRRGILQSQGYYKVYIHPRRYYAHQLAWLYVYGKFPEGELDHVNRDYSDNRIANLRQASRQQNSINQKLRSDNRSGYKGVTWREDCGKWLVQISKDRRDYYLGLFANIIDAAKAYDNAAFRLYGTFAKLNFPGATK
jgi:hypothetical protein